MAPYEHSREFLTHLEQRGLASSHYNMLSFMLQKTWVEWQLLPDKWPGCRVDQGHRLILRMVMAGHRPKEGYRGILPLCASAGSLSKSP